MMHDAENLEKNGDYVGGLKGFEDCFNKFAAIRQADPDWEPALVGHRMDDCKVTIKRLQSELAAMKHPTNIAQITQVNFVMAAPKKAINQYPWHTGIRTEMFWLGDKSVANAWSLPIAQGADDPEDRNGFASGSHASYYNPFYVALPFNDLTNPDKAKQYLPAGWARAPKDGSPVSACKDRWVEIKAEDGSGKVCYAQWEDVGPLRTDHAEYIFGPERPDTGNRAGLQISPAVVQYLGLQDSDSKNHFTRWRFVDAEDLPPGVWLKLDEEALLYTALHHSDATSTTVPVKAPETSTNLPPGSSKP